MKIAEEASGPVGAEANGRHAPAGCGWQARVDREIWPSEEMLCRMAMVIASVRYDVTIEAIAHRNRCDAHVCEARQVACYLAHVVFRVSHTRAGAAFGRDRTSIAHAVRRVEDRREDSAFDQMMTRAEALANGILEALCDPASKPAGQPRQGR